MAETIVIVAVALVIGMIGEIAKKLVGAKAGDPGWKGVYFVTFRAHGLVAGAGLMLALWAQGLPLPEFFGEGAGGAVLAGLFAGGLAMIGYDVLYEGVRGWLRHKLAVTERTSMRPPPGDGADV